MDILQEYTFRLLSETAHSLFLTGKAGTGKSTFLREAVGRLDKQTVVLAPTGIAAIQVRGETIHAFFKLPFGPLLPDDRRLRQIRYDKDKKELIRSLELLVIDEVSMVRADLLDAIDTCLRKIRKRPEPFGGVQMLLVGDLFQLEPVCNARDREILDAWYLSPYFFHSRACQELSLINIELETVYRQADEDFIELLDRIRLAEPSYEDLVLLNHLPKMPPPEDASYCITLTGTRAAAEATNKLRLEELPGEVIPYRGTIHADFPLHLLPTDELLLFKAGCQVIFIRNDVGPWRRWANGTLGVVVEAGEDVLRVRLRDGSEHRIDRVRWENIRYIQDDQGKIQEEVLGSFEQYPLALAWAVTIHKSQGLTFDRICIDLGQGAFAAGQLYVALSRCRQLGGIYLKRRLRRSDAMVRDEVLDYYRQILDKDNIRQLLDG